MFILEYPGYGDRPGKPGERAFFEAAEGAFRFLPRSKPIYLLDESLGTGIAAYLAGSHPVDISGVLLFAPYNSLVHVAQHHLRILPARLLMVDRFPSAEHLHRYDGPVAIVVGGKDRVVPQKFWRKLYDSYNGPKRLWEIPLGSHESIQHQGRDFWNELGTFWRIQRIRTKTNTADMVGQARDDDRRATLCSRFRAARQQA